MGEGFKDLAGGATVEQGQHRVQRGRGFSRSGWGRELLYNRGNIECNMGEGFQDLAGGGSYCTTGAT
jgi:hypothetical protein